MRVPGLVLLAFLVAAPVPAAEPGADKDLDDAIQRALEYLHNSQDKTDGSWRAGGRTKSTAITGLSVMAFLSAGHVPGEGPYGETVEKGVRWVLKQQQENGIFLAPTYEANHEMYHHGICTLMLAEVAGMTRGPLADEIKERLPRAVNVILRAQAPSGPQRGGWRYRAFGHDADMSVTGWQLMALRAAKNVGCDVPGEHIELAVDYIQRSREPYSGGYRYQVGGGVTVPCTGTAVLALELCGKEQHRSPDLLKAGAYLIRNPPHWGQPHFCYGIYYCSQAMFQLGGNYWENFRPRLHEVLLRNQNGNGSWVSRGSDGHYGASYATAMGVLALTVEYRFLPIYQRSEEPAAKGK
jgi:hypothetical protein